MHFFLWKAKRSRACALIFKMTIKEGIDKAVNRNTSRFFMPGHNGDGSIPLHYDVTEIDGTDNLRCPGGIIRTAQQNAAVAFGAMHTFFLVNGSSVGIHAAIMSVCQRGDTLIVDRGCHVSVINAMVLGDIRPVYVYPRHLSEFGISSSVDPCDIERAYSENPKAKGVLITSPSYYGICSDIYAISQTVHKNNGTLIVDEAHGAHFSFSEQMPQSALMCGADCAIQSAHKTLPCMTQGAMLHLGTSRISPDAVRESINLLQTTSPSYLILTSIDEAVCEMVRNGGAALARVARECTTLKNRLNETLKYKCLENDDVSRLVINAGENACAVNDRLIKQHNIIIEMCDGRNLVLIAKAASKPSDFTRLSAALLNIAVNLPALERAETSPLAKTVCAVPPSEAYYGKTETVKPQNAVGRIAARAVYKTPPCICVLAPGDKVTEEIAETLTENIIVSV